jgi:hypothetical protein
VPRRALGELGELPGHWHCTMVSVAAPMLAGFITP